MFEITTGNLLELLKAIDESGVDSFRLKTDEFEITVSCGAGAPPPGPGDAGAADGSAVDVGTRVAPDPGAPADDADVATRGAGSPAGAQSTAAPEPAGPNPAGVGSPVTAPVVGTFYLAPEPGASPFVQVGDEVTAQTTVGLVEAMKVFTAVPAGRDGVVTAVLVGNGDFVEYGQALFLIADGAEPSAGPDAGGATPAPTGVPATGVER